MQPATHKPEGDEWREPTNRERGRGRTDQWRKETGLRRTTSNTVSNSSKYLEIINTQIMNADTPVQRLLFGSAMASTQSKLLLAAKEIRESAQHIYTAVQSSGANIPNTNSNTAHTCEADEHRQTADTQEQVPNHSDAVQRIERTRLLSHLRGRRHSHRFACTSTQTMQGKKVSCYDKVWQSEKGWRDVCTVLSRRLSVGRSLHHHHPTSNE
jgi:hypothetical protein